MVARKKPLSFSETLRSVLVWKYSLLYHITMFLLYAFIASDTRRTLVNALYTDSYQIGTFLNFNTPIISSDLGAILAQIGIFNLVFTTLFRLGEGRRQHFSLPAVFASSSIVSLFFVFLSLLFFNL